MEGGWAARVARWLLPVWLVYAAVWVAWWGYRLTAGGGLTSASEVVVLVLSGVAGILGLLNGWIVRRAGRTTDRS
jgi:hypothetical protein